MRFFTCAYGSHMDANNNNQPNKFIISMHVRYISRYHNIFLLLFASHNSLRTFIAITMRQHRCPVLHKKKKIDASPCFLIIVQQAYYFIRPCEYRYAISRPSKCALCSMGLYLCHMPHTKLQLKNMLHNCPRHKHQSQSMSTRFRIDEKKKKKGETSTDISLTKEIIASQPDMDMDMDNHSFFCSSRIYLVICEYVDTDTICQYVQYYIYSKALPTYALYTRFAPAETEYTKPTAGETDVSRRGERTGSDSRLSEQLTPHNYFI